jgi:uncharacterized phage protein gp47/JayE
MAELKRIDYTTKDYAGYREDMIDLIPSKLPEWTDRSDLDPGIVILELLAYQLEKLSYYNDRVANESFLSTATQRRSVINHCKLIGYELGWHKAAVHKQVFEFVPQVEDIIIPKGTMVGTRGSDIEDSVIFELLEDLVIPAGATGLEKDVDGNYLYSVDVEHGQTIKDEFLGDITTDLAYQELPLTYYPVLKESIEVFVEDLNGRYQWERVQDFLKSSQDSMHYTTEMNEYDKVFIGFGSGASGKIPTSPSKVYASYKVGGGTDGNVGSNTITEFFEAIPGYVSTFNPEGPKILGTDKESIETAKVNGPASLRVLNRYVTISDFEEGVVIDYPAIQQAKAINVGGAVDLYVLPKEEDILSQAQKDELTALIDEKKVLFTTVAIKDPTYVTINVTIDVMVLDNFDKDFIRYTADNTVRDILAKENTTFGKPFTYSDLHVELRKILGVTNVIISSPVSDVVIGETEIAKLGTLTITINGA